MTARTGAQYKEGLKDDRQIWLGDGKISVAEGQLMSGSVDGMAGYFDWQLEYADECLIPDPEKPGEKMNEEPDGFRPADRVLLFARAAYASGQPAGIVAQQQETAVDQTTARQHGPGKDPAVHVPADRRQGEGQQPAEDHDAADQVGPVLGVGWARWHPVSHP